jgi:hypothetical protein
MKPRELIVSSLAVAAWTAGYFLSIQDTISLGYAIAAVVVYLALVVYTGVRITSSASDPRGDGKESLVYGVAFGLISLSTLLPLANLLLAFSGYYLNPRLLGFAVGIVTLAVTPAAVLLSVTCRHHASILPRVLTPAFAIGSALLCRMFYR